MHVHLRRALAATLLTAGAALTSASCARNDSSIFVRGVLVVSRTDCTFQISTTPDLILQGTIDAAYAGEYRAVVLVENQMVPRGNPTTLKTETSGVQLYEAEVQVLDPSQGNGALAKFSTPVTGYVDPGTAGQPGAGGSEVLMIDAATLQTLSATVQSAGTVQEVVSSVVIKGRTLGGLEVHTQEFLFPISVFFSSTCSQPAGMPCVSSMGSSAAADCRLGLDAPANCQNIYGNLGACGHLECDFPAASGMAPELINAHCPTHVPPNNSCCGL